MAKAMTTEERLQALAEYDPKEHLIKIKGRDGMMKDYLPAAWRFYELSLRYPNANFSIDLIMSDQEKNFCVVRARLYLGASYEASDKKAESMKQGQMSALDKAETAAKARCSRDFGIGTEYALEFSDEDVDEVGHPPSLSPSSPKSETSTRSTSPSSSPPSQPQVVTRAKAEPVPPLIKVTPAVPLSQAEPRKEKMVDPLKRDEINKSYKVLVGPYEWRTILGDNHISLDDSTWTEPQAFAIITTCEKWIGSLTQKTWLGKAILPEQLKDFDRLAKVYGVPAIKKLRDSIPTIKGKSSADMTREQADTFLAYLFEAEPVFVLSQQVDPNFEIAKSFKGVTHILDFVVDDRPLEDGSIDAYRHALEERAAKQAA